MNGARLQFCKEKLKIKHIINAAIENTTDRLKEITNGDMPTVVIDCTGNQKAINNALQWLAHGGRYVLIGLQKEELIFSHPEFHKRETTLMSSRNATREDFMHVMNAIKQQWIDPATYITHRVKFDGIKDVFDSWLNPATGVIKAMVEMD
jgi:threonine dehydrogenase-like Zn-dependent dehydrogenase